MHVDGYEYAGTGGSGAPLLLIHGWGMHGGVWGGIAEQLAQHFRVFAVDLPGHGYSANNKSVKGQGARDKEQDPVFPLPLHPFPFALDSIVDELSARFTGPLAVCGWSLGGQVALRWAMRQPQQVNRLVLVASTPCFVQRFDWPCAMAAETLAEFDAAVRQNYAQTLRRFLALQVRGSERERDLLATLRGLLFSRGDPDPDALQSGLDILRDCDLRGVLPGIGQAALVIAGERDTLTPPSAAQYLASHLPNARLAMIKGAAHAPFLSHPEQFLDYAVDFLSE